MRLTASGRLRNIPRRVRDYSQLQVMNSRKCGQLTSGTIVAQTNPGGKAASLTKLMKIECILCPTDLSADSDEALRYAIALSRAYNAELILLHCDVIGDERAKQGAHDQAAEAIKGALMKHSGSTDLAGLDWRSLVISCDDAGAAMVVGEARALVDPHTEVIEQLRPGRRHVEPLGYDVDVV